MPSFPTNEYFDQAPGGILIYGREGLRYANPAAISLLAGAGFSLSPGDPLLPAFGELSQEGTTAVVTLEKAEFQVHARSLAGDLLLELHPYSGGSTALNSQFARLSDRLRLPLSRLMGAMEHLSQADTQEQREDLQAISIRNLCSLIRTANSLQLYSELSSGQTVPMEVLNLAALCQELCDELESLLESARIGVSCQLKGAPLVFGSRSLLRQLLLNLVSNSIAAGADHITLTLSQSGGRAKLTLSDNGRGFPPERLETAFLPAQAANDFAENGLNLGLPLCQRIAQLHKGILLLDTAPEGGTGCILSLPLTDRNQPQVHAPAADFSAGYPDFLAELSDVLPFSFFRPEFLE